MCCVRGKKKIRGLVIHIDGGLYGYVSFKLCVVMWAIGERVGESIEGCV